MTTNAAASAAADTHARPEIPRSRGRTATQRTTPATTRRANTAPIGPSAANKPTANAAPTSWLIAATTTNNAGPTGDRRCTQPTLASMDGGGDGRCLRAGLAGRAVRVRRQGAAATELVDDAGRRGDPRDGGGTWTRWPGGRRCGRVVRRLFRRAPDDT